MFPDISTLYHFIVSIRKKLETNEDNSKVREKLKHNVVLHISQESGDVGTCWAGRV